MCQKKPRDFILNSLLVTTVHSWCDGYSTSISACGMWEVGGKDWGLSFKEGVSHTYIFRLG